MWQLWLCLLGALLLGATLGWLLRSGGKRKLAKITKEWSQQFNLIEKERDAFAAKVKGVKQLNYENESLLGRLSSMEKGANLASDVLKDNKARLDYAEHHLLEANGLLEQRDAKIISLKNDLSGLEGKETTDQNNQQSELSDIVKGLSIEYEQENAEITSKLILKKEEIQVLSDEINDLTERLAQAEKQLDDDGEKIEKLTDVYEKQVKSARVFKSQIIRSGSDLREKLKNKETTCEGLEQEIELAKKEVQENIEKMRVMAASFADQEKTNEMLVASEQDNSNEMKIMQGLIAAHEQGSDDSSVIEAELQQEIEKIKKINDEDKNRISACKDELIGIREGIQSSKEREQSALNEVEMIQALLVAQEEGNQQLLETKKQLQKALLNADEVSVKQEERATKYKAELARKKNKQTQQSRLDITELEDLEKQLKRLQLDTKITTDNGVLGGDNRATKNESNESYVIGEIEGIGKGLSKRLRKIGVYTTTDLLERCKNNSIDKHLMNALNQGEKTIQSWCYMADLLRIKGVNGKYANVLFLAGIHSTEMLAESDVNEIKSNIKNRVKTGYYLDKVPTKKMMANWIYFASKLIK